MRAAFAICAGLAGSLPAGAAFAQAPSSPPAPRAAASGEPGEATTRLRAARELFGRENFDAALVEFQRVHELLAGAPQQALVLYNIALCQERLGRYNDAIGTYRRYLSATGPDAPYREEVQGTLRTLDGLLGVVTVQSNVARAEIWIDDHRVGEAPGEVRVPAGRHVVMLRAQGYVPSQQEVAVIGRSSRTLRFALERLSTSRGLPPVFFWTALGATAVTAVAGTVFGVRALQMDADARASLDDPARRFTVTEALRSDVREGATITDVLIGTAGAFAIGTTVLYLLTDFRPRRGEPSSGRASALTLTPVANRSAAGISVVGAF